MGWGHGVEAEMPCAVSTEAQMIGAFKQLEGGGRRRT